MDGHEIPVGLVPIWFLFLDFCKIFVRFLFLDFCMIFGSPILPLQSPELAWQFLVTKRT